MTRNSERVKRYRAAWFAVWGNMTAIEQIMSGYTDPDAPDCEPTRYEIDMLNGLANALGAIVERNDWQ